MNYYTDAFPLKTEFLQIIMQVKEERLLQVRTLSVPFQN